MIPKLVRKSFFLPEGQLTLMFMKIHKRPIGIDVKEVVRSVK